MTTLVVPGDSAVAVKGPRQGKWTYADWELLGADDDNRYEIIDGVLYMTTAPKFFHQSIIQNLYDVLGSPAKKQGLAHIALAPIGVLMPGCDPVQPDFLIILKANEEIIHDGRIYGVPDLIVEVLSPGSVAYDEGVRSRLRSSSAGQETLTPPPTPPRIQGGEQANTKPLAAAASLFKWLLKLEAYARAGVPEYGVIDPAARALRLYTLREPGSFSDPQEFARDDEVRFVCLPSIAFRLSSLFENAPDTTV